MKNIIISIILFFNVINLHSQSNCDCYERLSLLAEQQLKMNCLDSALKTYQRAFSFIPDSAKNKFHFYNMSLYYSCNNKLDSASYYAIKAIKLGYKLDYLKNNKKFESLIYSSFWDDIKNTKAYLGNLNLDYYSTVQQLLGIDQAIRDKSKLGKCVNDSIYYFVDSINFYTIKDLIAEYGLPKVSTCGFHFNELLIFMMHASMYSDDIFNDVLDILYEANSEYLCTKDFIIMFIDRRLIWLKNQKQIAGTWNYSEKFNPISNIQNVDSIRFQYNLMNLNDYGKANNFELPRGYKKMEYPPNYFCIE